MLASQPTEALQPRFPAPHAQPDDALDGLLEQARRAARDAGLPYAGGLSPKDAWALFNAGAAVLVDVRTNEERKFVGHVPGSLHVAWATGTSMTRCFHVRPGDRIWRSLRLAATAKGPSSGMRLMTARMPVVW